jgi:hypothetical protein
VRLLPPLVAVSAKGRTARGIRSAVAGSSAMAPAVPALLRRLRVYPKARPAASTLTAVAGSSARAASAPLVRLGRCCAHKDTVAATLAAPAPPANCAVREIARTESVASGAPCPAQTALNAVAISTASTAPAAFDRFPNGSPCTHSGHGASVAAPGPSCPYSLKCVEQEFYEVGRIKRAEVSTLRNPSPAKVG